MANPPIHSLGLFSGVGMLDEGVRAGLEFLGREHRCIAYVEREAFAAGQLVALMEAGCLGAAPVWSDVSTFPAERFRGLVDLIVAGFPCQDISIAGKRAGLDGARSGLFFTILDIADACDASGLFLENVAAIATADASVVDEAEGELTERAASRILGELADRGWDAEWLHLSASDVGASHQRERWFCLAVRNGRGLGELADSCGAMPQRGGQATMRADGKSRMDMLDWRAESFSPQVQAIQDGQTSSPDSPTSRRRLNPMFAAWLMGWPSWWTNPAVTSSAQSAMASYRSALQRHLSSLRSG